MVKKVKRVTTLLHNGEVIQLEAPPPHLFPYRKMNLADSHANLLR